MYPRYKLIIETNSYTGNFYRELVSYVFGFYFDSAPNWVDALNYIATKELEKEMPDDEFIDLLCCFEDKYGQNCCEIDNKLITVFFNKNPGKYIDVIVNRLKKFPEVYAKSWEFANKEVKIIFAHLIEVETVSQEIQSISLL